jgi:hypothetical protein
MSPRKVKSDDEEDRMIASFRHDNGVLLKHSKISREDT